MWPSNDDVKQWVFTNSKTKDQTDDLAKGIEQVTIFKFADRSPAPAAAPQALPPHSFDMGAALSAFSFGDLAIVDEMGTVLRLIAQHSIETDVDGPKFMRVCRAFKYCWKLALDIVKINMSKNIMPVYSSGTVPLFCFPKAVQALIVIETQRTAKKKDLRIKTTPRVSFSVGTRGTAPIFHGRRVWRL